MVDNEQSLDHRSID